MKKYGIFSLGAVTGILATMLCVKVGSWIPETKPTKEMSNTNNSEIVYSTDAGTKESYSANVEQTEPTTIRDEDNVELTLVTTRDEAYEEEMRIKNIAIKNYMLANWDGTETDLEGHKVKLAENKGYLLYDSYICGDEGNLDIPESAYKLMSKDKDKVVTNSAYVPGQGTYTIIDHKLVKFLRGNKIELPGNELYLENGFTSDEITERYGAISNDLLYIQPCLVYNKIDGMLYLVCGDEDCRIDTDTRIVYIFDDPNVSEMRYLGKANFYDSPDKVDISTLEFF